MINGMKTAAQMYSVREEAERNLPETLKQLKSFGYDGIELAGLVGRTPAELRALADDIGLEIFSAHVPLSAEARDYTELGCAYLGIGWVEEGCPGKPGYEQHRKRMEELAADCVRQGMTLLYHNHDMEFAKWDGLYHLDRFLADIPDMQLELDTCWANVGGEDPAAYLSQYAGRAPVVHLKDFYMPGKKPTHVYSRIGVALENQDASDGLFELRPLGQGQQDIPGLARASAEVGAKWLVVEQDAPSQGKTALECMRLSLEYLQSIAE